MITFNNFKLNKNSPTINITIPRGSIVHLSQDFSVIQKFYGEILYENFPIHHAKKSFEKKLLCEIVFQTTLRENKTLEWNMKNIAKKFGTKLIWNIPLRYFNITQDMWKLKVNKLREEEKDEIKFGLALLSMKDILYFRNVTCNNVQNKKKIAGIIDAKTRYGNAIVFYSGENLDYEGEIRIIL